MPLKSKGEITVSITYLFVTPTVGGQRCDSEQLGSLSPARATSGA